MLRYVSLSKSNWPLDIIWLMNWGMTYYQFNIELTYWILESGSKFDRQLNCYSAFGPHFNLSLNARNLEFWKIQINLKIRFELSLELKDGSAEPRNNRNLRKVLEQWNSGQTQFKFRLISARNPEPSPIDLENLNRTHIF